MEGVVRSLHTSWAPATARQSRKQSTSQALEEKGPSKLCPMPSTHSHVWLFKRPQAACSAPCWLAGHQPRAKRAPLQLSGAMTIFSLNDSWMLLKK